MEADIAALAAVVGITVALIEGGIGLIKFLVNKLKKEEEAKNQELLLQKLDKIAEETSRLDEMHARFDLDGTPLWYVPRSWADTQKEIVDRLHVISEMNMKMLGIIERLERRIENDK